MIKAIVVSDSSDSSLGDFFDICGRKSTECLNSIGSTVERISCGNFGIILQEKISQLKNSLFLFACFSHGSKIELLQNGSQSFVSNDSRFLKKAFIYVVACDTGEVLGKDLCRAGAPAYVGYVGKYRVIPEYDYEKIFSKCALSGLIFFIQGYTVNDSVVKMKSVYTETIFEIYKKNSFAASILMENRDSLVVHGNGDFHIREMQVI